MKITTFQQFASSYAKVVAGRNIRITYGGDVAWTNGKGRINLPALPAGTTLTKWMAAVYEGYLDHELLHHRYTDLKNSVFTERGKELLRNLYNIFEDIRIENLGIVALGGIKVYLDACTQQIEYDKRDKEEKAKQDGTYKTPTKGYILLEAMYKECYKVHRKADCIFHYQPELSDFPEFKPIQKALTKLTGMVTEKQAIDLAQEVYDLLPKNLDYGERPKDANDFDFIFLPGMGSGDMAAVFAPILIAFMAANERTNGMDALHTEIKKNDKEIEQEIKQKAKQSGKRILPPATTEHDRIFVPSEQDMVAYRHCRDGAAEQILATKRMIEIYLRSRNKKSWERGLPDGRLDDDLLTDMMIGSTNVYKEKRVQNIPAACVQMMLDLSGSMRSDTTRLSAIVTAEALSSIPRIKFSIAGFTTGEHSYYPDTGGPYGRAISLDLMMFKDYNENYMQCQARLGAIESSGYTPLGEAYGHGFARLITRQEPKRVLWIISDGEPYIPQCSSEHSETLLMALTHEKCKRAGIKVVAINIGKVVDALKDNTDIMLGINSIRELPGAVLELLKEIAS